MSTAQPSTLAANTPPPARRDPLNELRGSFPSAFKAWFGKSRVVDAHGKPLVVYRGEHGDSDAQIQSRKMAISFGTIDAANTYAMTPNDENDPGEFPRVIPAYLRIENPIIDLREDPFVDGAELAKKLGKAEAERILIKFEKWVTNTGNWMYEINPQNVYSGVADYLKKTPDGVNNLYFEAYPWLDDDEEVARLKAAGFDGAIHGGSGATAGEIEYKVFDPSQIKSAIGDKETYDASMPDIRLSKRGMVASLAPSPTADASVKPSEITNPGGIRRSFAGPKALTSDRLLLETAQRRLAQGEDAEQVRQDTGWFRGADGKFRFEISDHAAALKHAGRYPPRILFGEYASDRRRQLADGGDLTLGDILEHPALFAAYPTLRDIPVVSRDIDGAAFTGEWIEIPQNATLDRALSSLLHEIQHSIQRIEDFASGGPGGARMWVGKWRTIALDEYRQIIEEMKRPMPIEDYAKQAWGSDEVTEEIRESYQNSYLPTIAQFLKREGVDVDLQHTAGWRAYKRLAGEVEARNTQARRHMTEEERRAISPEATQDTPSDNVILVFDDSVMKDAFAEENVMEDPGIGGQLSDLASKLTNNLNESDRPSIAEDASISRIRSTLLSAYGNLLPQLEARDMVRLVPTLDVAMEETARARSQATGQSLDDCRRLLHDQMMYSVANTKRQSLPEAWRLYLPIGGFDPTVTSSQETGVGSLVKGEEDLHKYEQSLLGDHLEIKRSAAGDVQGFYDPVAQKAFLIAEHMTTSTAPGVLMHEVGVHMAYDRSDSPQRQRLMQAFAQARRILNEGTGYTDDPILRGIIELAADRMETAGETMAEEAAAYLVTAMEEFRIRQQTLLRESFSITDPPSWRPLLGSWLQEMAASVRAWLFTKNVLIDAADLAAYDIAALARGCARRLAASDAVREGRHQVVQEAAQNTPTGTSPAGLSALRSRRFSLSVEDIIEPLRSRLGFYSALQVAVGRIKAAAMPAAGWKEQITSWINKGLAKREEVEWSGLEQWLDLQDQQGARVPRQAVMDFLVARGVQIEEVELRAAANDTKHRAQYQQYTLPGADNYREVLLKLPARPGRYELRVAEGKYRIWNNDTNDWARRPDGVLLTGYDTQADGQRAMSVMGGSQANNFRSDHWAYPNVLAHLRLNDRTDAAGRRVLFVEEIQSDWAQEGRKNGFQGKPVTGYQVQWEGRPLATYETAEEAQAHVNRARAIDADAPVAIMQVVTKRHAINEAAAGKLPAAPFVQKTESWLTLALKRLMVLAAEGGYDAVAFVSGQQSADRYDLSKQVDRVAITRTGDAWAVNAWKGGAKVITKDAPTDQDLRNIVGKELAERAIAEGGGEYSGKALKVGGDGMRAFYDTIVPNTLKALLKKLGVGDVETVKFGGDRRSYEETQELLNDYATYPLGSPQRKELLDYLDVAPDYGHDSLRSEQVGFTVTDDLRAKVLRGLPLFSRQMDRKNDVKDADDADLASALDRLDCAQQAWDSLRQRADRGEPIRLEEYASVTDTKLEAQKHLIACIDQCPQEGFVLQANAKAGGTLMLTASAQRPGCWQLTRFDANGEPWGDTQYPARDRALADFIEETDDLASITDAMGPIWGRAPDSFEQERSMA